MVGDRWETHVVPDTLGGFERKSGALCGFYGGVAAALSQERLFVLQNFEVQHLGFGAHGGASTLQRVCRFLGVCRAHYRC